MNDIILICPYFGRLPSYFALTLESIRANPRVNFLLLTDDRTEYAYPANMQVVYTDFATIKQRIAARLGFDVSGIKPYKLCDFKPFYGIIFADYVADFRFWGHCDFDVIFGDIRRFITDDVLASYEKILHLGHLSLYRSSAHMRALALEFLQATADYERLLTSEFPYQFDEVRIIDYIRRRGVAIYEADDDIADIYCLKKCFRMARAEIVAARSGQKMVSHSAPQTYVFAFDGHSVYGYSLANGAVQQREFMYLHLQKRSMQILASDPQHFLVVPNAFLPAAPITAELIERYSHEPLVYGRFWQIKWNNLKHKLKRMSSKWRK